MTTPANVAQVIRMRRGTAARWFEVNPVLKEGEPGYERDTGRFKIGDGISEWEDLPYFIPRSASASSPIGGSASEEAIYEYINSHINSPNPHSVYDEDDGPSLVLLYENAKV